MKVKVNGVEIYYQKLGKGHPLILLHGHHQDGGIFDKLVAPLSLYYTVVVPDMRGHGLSEGELEKPYILGFGSGGLVALSLAAQAPELVSKIIVAGTYVNGNGVNAKHIAANTIRGFFKGDRDSKVALRESHIPVETLKRIKTPTLCVVGEKDWVKVEHVRWYSQLLPNCRLVLMPRQTHYSYVVHSLKLLDLIKDFCKES